MADDIVLPDASNMAALGLFVFALDSLPYQQLQRNAQWRHPANSRVGLRPARQYAGPGDDTLTLTGTLYPELTGGQLSLELVRYMADQGKSWPLVQGDGTYYGMWVIESLDETATLFFTDGRARKIEFTLKLARVDDDDTELMGIYSDALMELG